VSHLVVGVDGSPQARRALLWAIDEARLRAVELWVVFAYPPGDDPSPYLRSYAFAADVVETGMSPDDSRWREQRATEARQQAERLLEVELEAALGGREDLTVAVHAVADDRPARALLAFGTHAVGLVVGSRGRGGFAGLLLGSVSQQLAQHAPCPVTIVPPTRDAGGDAGGGSSSSAVTPGAADRPTRR
jgi:nucleotide-binding universal stress UspA family protein